MICFVFLAFAYGFRSLDLGFRSYRVDVLGLGLYIEGKMYIITVCARKYCLLEVCMYGLLERDGEIHTGEAIKYKNTK